MRRTIAITGATGFVGSVLLKKLVPMDWHVRALVRPASMHKRPSQVVREWIPGDLEDMESLRRLVAGVEVVAHCAGTVRGASLTDFERINQAGCSPVGIGCPIPAARAPVFFDILSGCVNQVVEDADSPFLRRKAQLQQKYLAEVEGGYGTGSTRVPLFPYEIKGVERLKEVERRLFSSAC